MKKIERWKTAPAAARRVPWPFLDGHFLRKRLSSFRHHFMNIRFLPIMFLFLAFFFYASDLYAGIYDNKVLLSNYDDFDRTVFRQLDEVRRLLNNGEAEDAALALADLTEYLTHERTEDYATYLAGELALALNRPDVARQAFRRAWALRYVDGVPIDPGWIQRLEGRLKDLDPAVLAKRSAFSGSGAGIRAPIRALAVSEQKLYVVTDSGRLLRLGKDGSPDMAFQQTFESTAAAVCKKVDEAVAATADGGAVFFCAEPVRLIKLDSAGRLDPGFGDAGTVTLTGRALPILAVDSRGRIIVAGGQSHVGGVFAPYLARLKIDGHLDRTFAPDPQSLALVRRLALAPDDSIIAVIESKPDNKAAFGKILLRRFLADGTYDQDFGRLPAPSLTLDNNRPVAETFTFINTLGVRADGSIVLIGLVFKGKGDPDPAGPQRMHLLRLSRSGEIDFVGFIMGTRIIIPEPSGDVLLVGANVAIGGRSYDNAVIRLHPDGSLDEPFLEKQTGGLKGTVMAAVRGADGTIYLGGDFGLMGPNAASRNLIRLSPDGTPSRPVPPPAFTGIASLVPPSRFYFSVEDSGIVLASSDTNGSPVRQDGKLRLGSELCSGKLNHNEFQLLVENPRSGNADDFFKRHCLIKPGSTLAVHGTGWVRQLKVSGLRAITVNPDGAGDLEYRVLWTPKGLPGRALFASTYVSTRNDNGFRKAADLEVKKAKDIDRLRALLNIPRQVKLHVYADPAVSNSFVVVSHTIAYSEDEGRDIASDAVYYVQGGQVTTLLKPEWAGGCTDNDKNILGFLDADADGDLDILVDTSGPKVILERRPRGFRPLVLGFKSCGGC